MAVNCGWVHRKRKQKKPAPQTVPASQGGPLSLADELRAEASGAEVSSRAKSLVALCVSAGMTETDIAAALDQPAEAVRNRFGRELEHGCAIAMAENIVRLKRGKADAGSVPAQRALENLLPQPTGSTGAGMGAGKEAAAAEARAHNPDTSTPMGELMAERAKAIVC